MRFWDVVDGIKQTRFRTPVIMSPSSRLSLHHGKSLLGVSGPRPRVSLWEDDDCLTMSASDEGSNRLRIKEMEHMSQMQMQTQTQTEIKIPQPISNLGTDRMSGHQRLLHINPRQ